MTDLKHHWPSQALTARNKNIHFKPTMNQPTQAMCKYDAMLLNLQIRIKTEHMADMSHNRVYSHILDFDQD